MPENVPSEELQQNQNNTQEQDEQLLIYGSSIEEPDNEEWDLEELGNEERGNEEWDIQMSGEGGEGEWEDGEGNEGDGGEEPEEPEEPWEPNEEPHEEPFEEFDEEPFEEPEEPWEPGEEPNEPIEEPIEEYDGIDWENILNMLSEGSYLVLTDSNGTYFIDSNAGNFYETASGAPYYKMSEDGENWIDVLYDGSDFQTWLEEQEEPWEPSEEPTEPGEEPWEPSEEPIEEPVGGSGKSSIKLSVLTRLRYPTLAKVVDGLKNKVQNDTKLMNAIKSFTGLTETQILEKLSNTNGPELRVNRYMGDTNPGKYKPDVDPNVMDISEKLVTSTNFIYKDYGTALEFYMAVVILHEFIHYGQNYTQNYTPYDNPYDDPGFQFENEVFGGRLIFNYATGEISYETL